MSRFLTRRPFELAIYQLDEDAWGSHPERPVEVLDDGTQVWRVPPGTEVRTVFGTWATLLGPSDTPTDFIDRGPKWLWTRQPDGELRLLHWTELRRIGYPLDARAQEVREASHAAR